ncbi:MAG: glycine--tRNA ligase subunit beta [Caulobacterales bacterium]|nr:glycine--tRNA ligase subunit beta [Caulobacterales bacterium]
MPQLLIELFSEEIPARMQKRAEEDLARALGEKLKAHGLEPKAVKTFSSPRRLGAVIDDLPLKAVDVNEEKKGPRVGAPEQALQGFLKSAGLASIDQAQVVEDKKGAFYVAKIERAGRATAEIVAEIVPEIVRAFPWPKSMRSGESDLQWVRPLHNIACVFDGKAVTIAVEGVGSQAVTWGHRFHAPEALPITSAVDHASKLRGAKVLIEREERKAIILEQARKLCAAKGLELVEDIGLLEEVCGLVEWPVTLLGDMDPAFLDLPGEVIRLSMRTHQKYFAVRDPNSGKLAPHFVTVANVEAKDAGLAIAAGNARVLSARLNDARFFWDTDKKTPLYTDERRAKLEKIVFHQKLGSVWDKVERVKALAAELCAVTGADVEAVQRAAELAKMDLVTETVGEFPELQGQVGRQLYLLELNSPPPRAGRGQGAGRDTAASDAARESERRGSPHPPAPSPRGEGESIAAAIEDHYRPLGPNDRVPEDKVAVTLALADKLDTLVGFWAIDEKPTGSSDPYALRRAGLGQNRSILSGGYSVALRNWIDRAAREVRRSLVLQVLRRATPLFPYLAPVSDGGTIDLNPPKLVWPPGLDRDFDSTDREESARAIADYIVETIPLARPILFAVCRTGIPVFGGPDGDKWLGERYIPAETVDVGQDEIPACFITEDLLSFLADRLKVQLRDQGKRHDLVDAVFALGDDDLVRIVARVEALDAFLKTEDGANLLAGYKRAANILAAEEKKGKWSADEAQGQVDASKLAEPAERALHVALESAVPTARSAVEKEEFASAMKALAGLRAPVDQFFEKVLVNAEDAMLRRNRLLLLSRLREALSQVADFSKIEG